VQTQDLNYKYIIFPISGTLFNGLRDLQSKIRAPTYKLEYNLFPIYAPYMIFCLNSNTNERVNNKGTDKV